MPRGGKPWDECDESVVLMQLFGGWCVHIHLRGHKRGARMFSVEEPARKYAAEMADKLHVEVEEQRWKHTN